MNARQEYRKRAKDESKVYFHFDMDRKYSIPSKKGGAWQMWAVIDVDTAKEIHEFFRKLEKEGKL